MREIKITDIKGARWGHASDEDGGTGLTVVLTRDGAAAGADIRGGGPASREVALLDPVATCEAIHGLVLSGGSAFALDAATGVMDYLAKDGIGVDVGVARVPLVVQSDIFDLDYKSTTARPNAAMAQEACADADTRACTGADLPQGSVGVGCGATVGKALGPALATKSGVGHYAVELGPVQIGALAVCNAIGDVFDIDTGERIAGIRATEGACPSTEQLLYDLMSNPDATDDIGAPHTNTTLGVLVTNIKYDKTKMTKVAMMTQNGLARTLRPVHTSFDGDVVYALSLGDVELPTSALDGLGTLGAYVMGKAINNAVRLAR